jgi:glycosyltransferase involved in cell wall biosynthesis
MRVLHLLVRMPANGTERQLAGMLRAAHGRRWDATLCVLHGGFPLARELAETGVPTIELDSGGGVGGRLLRLRRQTRSGSYQVVHSSLWGGNVAARLAAASPSRPAVVISERRVEDFRPRSHRLVDLALRPLTDEYIGNSDDVGEFIARAHRPGPDRITVIPNGLDAEVFHPVADSRARDGRPLRVGAMGRLVRQKGFDVLLAALPHVLEGRRVELAIAGAGDEEASLRTAAAGLPVRFLGPLATPTVVADFLRGLDLFVMPSRYEGLPNAVIEALACGVPVVATDVPGMAEATAGQARLVTPDDAAGLATAVLEALADNRRPERPPVPTFLEVADAHLEVFERAVRRRAGLGRASAARSR